MQQQSTIALKHLLIDKPKMIGLEFHLDKVIQALVKELPEVKWSNRFKIVIKIKSPMDNLDI